MYDANGNRTQATFGANTYVNTINAGSNRLSSTAGPAPAKQNAYDAGGNLTNDGNIQYSYGSDRRLSSVVVGGISTGYRYNGLGQRVEKKGGAGAAVRYVYDEAGRLIGEYDDAGKAIQETVYLGDLPMAVMTPDARPASKSQITSSSIAYVFTDQLSTPRVIIRGSDNNMIWRWDGADPFGLEHPDQNPNKLGKFTYNPRFPGQYYDSETNLHYNYFRDYDPQTARYVQSDPVGLRGGINTYSYVEGSPLSKADPFGLRSTSEPTEISLPNRLPGLFDILTPGTSANNAFVKSVSRLIKNVNDACSSSDLPREECKKECVSQYERDATACEVAYIGYGKRGFAVCMARAGDYLGQCLKSCEGK